jgi:hypothetical protein
MPKTQCHSISMLISDDLHLNVPSTLAKLHHEDRRSWNFILHLDEASASKIPGQDSRPNLSSEK